MQYRNYNREASRQNLVREGLQSKTIWSEWLPNKNVMLGDTERTFRGKYQHGYQNIDVSVVLKALLFTFICINQTEYTNN